MKRICTSTLILCAGLASIAWAQQQKGGKPLAGYTQIVVEPYSVENSKHTKDFPAGEETHLQLRAIAALRASDIFEKVVDGNPKSSLEPPPSGPSSKEGKSTVILASTIIRFDKGSSAARFATWPLPVGVSKAKAHFVFRDAANNQQVLSFEKEAKFQATVTGGISTEEDQMSHIRGDLAEALVKEIKQNR